MTVVECYFPYGITVHDCCYCNNHETTMTTDMTVASVMTVRPMHPLESTRPRPLEDMR